MILGLDGKDSLVTWLRLLDHWPQECIIPIHQMPVPDPETGMPLRYKAQGLDKYARLFDTPIYSVPHPMFWAGLAYNVYQPPDRFSILAELSQKRMLPLLTHHEYSKWIREQIGLPNAWTALGIKANDSPTRRHLIRTHGSAFPNPKNRSFYPIWDLTKADEVRLLKEAGVPLTIEYDLNWFSRSFCGIDARFTQPLRDYAPDDFARVQFWFPLVHYDHARLAFRRALLKKAEAAMADPGPKLHALQESIADGVIDLADTLTQRQKQEQTAAANLDAGYWTALIFQSRENKEAFLLAVGASEATKARQYMSGEELASQMGIVLPIPAMPNWKKDATLATLVDPALGTTPE